jgi:hypothetical protein
VRMPEPSNGTAAVNHICGSSGQLHLRQRITSMRSAPHLWSAGKRAGGGGLSGCCKILMLRLDQLIGDPDLTACHTD